MKRFVMALALYACVTAVHADPLSNAEVLSNIQSHDAKASQGTVALRVENHVPARIGDINLEVAKLKKQLILQGLDKAKMDSRLYLFRRELEISLAMQHESFDMKMEYSKDSMWRRTLVDSAGTSFSVYDGRNYAFVRQDMTVLNARSSISDPASFSTHIAPGPCFAFGRGLSKIEDVSVSSSGSALLVSGKYHGQPIEANLDPHNSYLASHIVLRNPPDGLLGDLQWTYGPVQRSKDGVYYPRWSRCLLKRKDNSIVFDKTYYFKSINHDAPPRAAFHIPLTGEIQDNRLGMAITFPELPDDVSTAEGLLPYTQKRYQDFMREHPVESDTHPINMTERMQKVFGWILLGTVLFSTYMALRRWRMAHRQQQTPT